VSDNYYLKIFVVMISSMPLAEAFICHASIWLKYDAILKQERYIVTFSDCHIAGVKHNQSEAIKDLIAHADSQCKFIVEDIGAYEGSDKHLKKEARNIRELIRENDFSLLPHLTALAKKYTVAIENVEWRFANTDILKFLEAGPKAKIPLTQVTAALEELKSAHKDLKQRYAKLEIQHDSFYDTTLKHVKEYYHKVLPQIEQDSASIIEGFQEAINAQHGALLPGTAVPQKIRDKIGKYNSLLAHIVDLRALHAIVTSQARKLFLFMGGAHIDNITKVLEDMGYKKIRSAGSNEIIKKISDASSGTMSILDAIKLYFKIRSFAKTKKIDLAKPDISALMASAPDLLLLLDPKFGPVDQSFFRNCQNLR
jgi:hypothetical protein